MTDAKEAYDDLQEMLKEFRKDPYGKFKDDRVIWLVTMWLKVAVAAKGPGMYSPLKLQFLKKGKPGKPPTSTFTTWKQEAYAALMEFKDAMSQNKDNPNPQKFENATNDMVGFVQEFRGQYKPDSTQDKGFENSLRAAFMKLDKEMGGS